MEVDDVATLSKSKTHSPPQAERFIAGHRVVLVNHYDGTKYQLPQSPPKRRIIERRVSLIEETSLTKTETEPETETSLTQPTSSFGINGAAFALIGLGMGLIYVSNGGANVNVAE